MINPKLIMPVHSRPVDVYYMRESLQNKPFAELALITCNASGYVSDSIFLEQAKGKAQQLGADGLYVLGREEVQKYEHSYYANTSWPSTVRTAFRALAIVYHERLRDSIPYDEARASTVAVLRNYENIFVVKRNDAFGINLYRFPEDKPENILLRITDSEPMQLFEKTDVILYSRDRMLRSNFFKVQYRNQIGYVSGFEIVEQRQ